MALPRVDVTLQYEANPAFRMRLDIAVGSQFGVAQYIEAGANPPPLPGVVLRRQHGHFTVYEVNDSLHFVCS